MDITNLLIDRGVLSREQSGRLRPDSGQRFDQAVVEAGFAREEEVLGALAEALNLQLIELDDVSLDSELLQLFPRSAIVRNCAIPIRDRGDVVEVATSDPFDVDGFNLLSAVSGRSLEPVLAPRDAIKRLIHRHLGMASETVDELVQQASSVDEEAIAAEQGLESDEAASVIRLVNQLLLEAVAQGASDVHMEPGEGGLGVRFRVDGMLRSQPIPAEISRFYTSMLTRLKIMAQLNIAEKRRPQDGRIQMRVGGREIDLRISTIPVVRGEGVVLRLLDKQATLLALPEMGLPEKQLGQFRKLIRRPHGVFLVTGPTGSGKTTTLYSAIGEIADESVKIITAEDPVEYEVEGISQIQVQPKVDLTFASSLRSMLRHDPDVILIGEIRDRETAESAIRAALTGHLVLSTLHTNDAAAAYTRLIEMGIEPFLVSSSVVGVLAQRLVRKLCVHCSEPSTNREDFPADFRFAEADPASSAIGCSQCGQSGYRGRIGIFELLPTDEEVRALCLQQASSAEIRAAAGKKGFQTMREDGWCKVRRGVTSCEEVLRITPDSME